MPDEVITGLNEDIVFGKNFDWENFIIMELIVHDMASFIKGIPSKIIDSDIPIGITYNEEVGVWDNTGCWVDFVWSSALIVYQNLFGNFVSSMLKVHFPQTNIAIITASHKKEFVSERGVDGGCWIDCCSVDALSPEISLTFIFVNILAITVGNLPDTCDMVWSSSDEKLTITGYNHGVDHLTMAFESHNFFPFFQWINLYIRMLFWGAGSK